MDNELGKEELLMKNAEMSLLLLCIEWGPILAGGTVRNCVSEQFWEKWGCPEMCLSRNHPPSFHRDLSLEDVNFPVFYVTFAHWMVSWFLSHVHLKWGAGICNELSMANALKSSGPRGCPMWWITRVCSREARWYSSWECICQCQLHVMTSDYPQSSVSSSIKWWE